MNPAKKAQWITALRSGEYPQGTGALRFKPFDKDMTYCCLGVLSDINGCEWDGDWARYGEGGRVESAVLPRELAIELGIDKNPEPFLDGYDNLDTPDGALSLGLLSLATLNDDGFTFDQIADIIEYFM